MEGKIKWFSEEKGYGFIFGNDGKDRFFHVSAVTGAVLPNNGDQVTFDSMIGKKGLKAQNVVISKTQTGNSSKRSDERVICKSCDKKMIPRVITGPPLVHGHGWTPVPKKSICPFCGNIYQKFSPSRGEKFRLVIFVIFILFFIAFSIKFFAVSTTSF